VFSYTLWYVCGAEFKAGTNQKMINPVNNEAGIAMFRIFFIVILMF
jgi:hypothetical protein